MNYNYEDTTVLAVSLTEEFLDKFAARHNLAERRQLRKEALPYVLGYLQFDGMVGLQSSSALFRAALQEQPLSLPDNTAPVESVIEIFSQTDEFNHTLSEMDLIRDQKPHSDTEEFKKYLIVYLLNQRKGLEEKHNLFSNSLTTTQDNINHKILLRTVRKLHNTQIRPEGVMADLHEILQHAHACQQQLSNPQPSVKSSKMGR